LSKDNTAPERFRHTNHPDLENVDTHWEQQLTSTKGPTRLNATQTPAQLAQSEYEASVNHFIRKGAANVEKHKFVGGVCINPACKPKVWSSGDHWNIDSNIRKWTQHEVKRNAAGSSHDVHRHDQIQRFVLMPQKDGTGIQKPRLCMSGAVSSDCCFLEAWGFDLGLRDRQAKPASLWKPVSRTNQFRGPRSFDRQMPRIHDFKRTLLKSQSLPDFEQVTLKLEDMAGEVETKHCNEHDGFRGKRHDDCPMCSKNVPVTEHGGPKADEMAKMGRTHNSRSCNFWDSYDHAAYREAAKLSCAIHAPVFRKHREDYPFVDEIELHPSAIYTRKFREKGGLLAMRGREGNSRHVPGQSPKTT
jgi:hypothetical protein